MKTYACIKNGRVLDPFSSTDKLCDVLIENGKIKAVGFFDEDHLQGADIIDVSGCWVLPGLIDLHTHLREPGQTHKETIASGTKAAAAGGFTTLCCMPNTEPYADSPEVIRDILSRAAASGAVHVLPVAGLTLGQKGQALSPMSALVEAGACAFSEDGRSVSDDTLMEEAMRNAAALGVPILSHCEDIALVAGGVVHQGVAAKKFHVPGISNASEAAIVKRDIALAAKTGARLHICHISAADSVRAVKDAPVTALVTAEVCPHHFAFCDEDIQTDDGRYKMNPPLRARADRDAVRAGLANGTLSVIATDHAPHHQDEKNKGLRYSAFGVVGLETAVGAGITHLVNTKVMTPLAWVAAMTLNPARVLGIDKGTLRPGAAADITVIDPHVTYKVDPGCFASMGQSTPFAGVTLTGRVRMTWVDGTRVYNDKEAVY